jgi:exopolysaccharide biosynthesis polyprenyl glycosylphosphotransferase
MGIEELLVTIASNFHQDILSLLLPATSAGVRVKVVPDLFDVIAGHVHNTQILGEQLMELLPVRLSFWQRTIKALMDRVLAFVVLTAGLPVWAAVALVIRLESRGPVFYRQERVGQGGVRFRIFKFRSMIRDAEKHTGPVWAGKDDPRITRVGAVLRKTRLDEIPQFINVILGEMSVVGPRPERPRFVEELRTVYPFYDKRLTIKPGITGWAQVKLEYDTSIEDVAEKLKLDFYYIENMSLYLDLEILARTLVVVLTGRGAH